MPDRIILKKNTKQRLELSKTDLQLLAFLEQQRMLTMQQLYQVATKIFEIRIKEYSFKNRIRKFEDYYLIRGYNYSEGFDGERFKYLCIGSKGIDLLIKYNLLDQSYNKSKIYKFNQKKNLMHFLATQQAAINILNSLHAKVIKGEASNEIKYTGFYDITLFSHSPSVFQYTEWIRKEKNWHRHNKGAYHSYIAKHMNGNSSTFGKTMTFVKPDWIIELQSKKAKNAYINIELDMGTEPIETLIEKVFKYAILAERNKEELHIMDLVIADSSFSNRSKLTNGIKRGDNIIKRFVADPAIKKRLDESGLMLIIHPLRDNEKAIDNVLTRF
ncbi:MULTISPECIES: replication-relaxation family protein [unclassified Oceanobacillus]|uniref:replication-relaxation family protein n=1 Tax=unclassified Oceanobacillus TaxID=2630292 RepID=UPI00300DE4B7